MKEKRKRLFAMVRRMDAEDLMLTFLAAFTASVIITRIFLQLTGFPQIGNSVWHIAHALWGGLLLMVAVLLPIMYTNSWAIQASALLGGLGVGLFIDEVGKFISQSNDYFFPPAIPIIYGFVLLIVILYFSIRRPRREDPYRVLHHVFDGFKQLLDGKLDSDGASRIKAYLEIARRSDKREIVGLAETLTHYLEVEKQELAPSRTDFWDRIRLRWDAFGKKMGRKKQRVIISIILPLWVAFVIGYLVILIRGRSTIDPQVLQWRSILIGLQGVIGCSMVIALIAWLRRNEEFAVRLAIGGFLLSLVALQMLYFYISQFSALTATLIQFAFIQFLHSYRRWYLVDLNE
jgi:hypothetical protein